jgi:hypothetical protein
MFSVCCRVSPVEMPACLHLRWLRPPPTPYPLGGGRCAAVAGAVVCVVWCGVVWCDVLSCDVSLCIRSAADEGWRGYARRATGVLQEQQPANIYVSAT